jgi:hypothetical protein
VVTVQFATTNCTGTFLTKAEAAAFVVTKIAAAITIPTARGIIAANEASMKFSGSLQHTEHHRSH